MHSKEFFGNRALVTGVIFKIEYILPIHFHGNDAKQIEKIEKIQHRRLKKKVFQNRQFSIFFHQNFRDWSLDE